MTQTSCPRAKSDMTPCYIKNGDIAIALKSDHQTQICVGCEHLITSLYKDRLQSEEE